MKKLTVTTPYTRSQLTCASYKYIKGDSFGTLITFDEEGKKIDIVTIGNAIGGNNPEITLEE